MSYNHTWNPAYFKNMNPTMKEPITSLQNPLVKKIIKLQQKSAERARSGLFVAEGRREVSLALSQGVEPEHLLFCEGIFENDDAYPVALKEDGKHPMVPVSRLVYNKLAYRKDAEGVMLVGKQRLPGLSQLHLPETPLILVLEGLEKPGNLGAVLRTADAAGVDALILAGSKVDVYNPNTIRASMGCVFTVPVVACSSDEAIGWISDPGNWEKGKEPHVFSAALQTKVNHFEVDMTGPSILAFGAEDKGLSAAWRDIACQTIRIPMSGTIDSLNVSASVAILTFEAIRQRYRASDR